MYVEFGRELLLLAVCRRSNNVGELQFVRISNSNTPHFKLHCSNQQASNVTSISAAPWFFVIVSLPVSAGIRHLHTRQLLLLVRDRWQKNR
jgi:hypothetical protein